MGWWRIWTTNDTNSEVETAGGERRERVSWFFACFVIQSTDAEIDALVYGLYGVAREKIAIVEGEE